MEQFNLYIFFLCLIVFVLLTTILSTFVVLLVRYYVKMTKAGLNDEKIKIEYEKEKKKKSSVISKIIDKTVLILSCAVLFVAFIFSISISITDGDKVGAIPTLSVVQSGSMSYVNEKHSYIKEGDYTNQLQIFDLISLKKLPSEEDLKVGDVIVYTTKDMLIIHRIVRIEEPNEKHPNERYFLLQGDANTSADQFPVLYSQMKGIYGGMRIPFIGSFIMFMQAPAGWLCILLVVFAIIATPLAEKKIAREKALRIKYMLDLEKSKKLEEEKARALKLKEEKEKALKLKREREKVKPKPAPMPVNYVQLPFQGIKIVYEKISDASGSIYKPVDIVKFDPKDILNSINNGGGKQ